ncbi:uncharacterized protein LOC117511523 [Thalassophryne amazonica]|uniref:uncharacterized protein LOC117511523 n=1 Tax=Thalassophryne amazonica TaxID=390379 RepID=UPI001470C235|nr:uncharacterized protein LOC117511523 [Thalassophryne amazonica]
MGVPGSCTLASVETVTTSSFLGTHISTDIRALVKKAQRQLHFLHDLRKNNLDMKLLLVFYHFSVESVLTYCLGAWYAGSPAKDRKAVQRVINTAQKIIGCPLSSLETIATSCCLRRTKLGSARGVDPEPVVRPVPPFESTAPTLLSQLFQLIDSRYHGDAHRCLLDFMIPAKYILDTVQEVACSQFSGTLFLSGGWPLCLCDQLVVHLAPIDSTLLCPGDCYLQVAPGDCDQSARLVVCSLLDTKEAGEEIVVEETEIPEASYSWIFSCAWLEEINQSRHGTPFIRCLLAKEEGVVRIPWQQVALPEFVGGPQCSGKSMASAFPPIPPPPPHHLSGDAAENSYPNLPPTFSPPKELAQSCQSSVLPLASHSSAFSVETRICPAKHGIAVSLCLVDTSIRSSPGLVRVKETETEAELAGWVSPKMWNNLCMGAAAETRTGNDTNPCRAAEKYASENTVQDNKNNKDPGSSELEVYTDVADSEYLDILKANRQLFNQAQALTDLGEAMYTLHEKTSWNELKAQEPRCRYRESYQAAIQNPLTFGMDKERGRELAVVEEDVVSPEGDKPPDAQTRNPWCSTQDMWCDTGMQNQSPSICKDSGEICWFPAWKPADLVAAASLDFRDISAVKCKLAADRTAEPLVEPEDPPRATNYSNLHSVNGTKILSFPSSADSQQAAVVDTSERCELVFVEDQNVRRQYTDSCAEIPRLHVVKCKNSTAFGLVSPKINRRKVGVPGGRDRTGRPIVEVYGDHQGWRPSVTSQELFQMFFYFHSIASREFRETGMMLIFDARKKNPQPQFYKALMTLQPLLVHTGPNYITEFQEQQNSSRKVQKFNCKLHQVTIATLIQDVKLLQEEDPHTPNSLVLLVQKENSHRPEKCPGIQTDVVTSIKSLLKLVDLTQLSCRLEGTLSHGHQDWTDLHQKLFPFVSDLHEVSVLLLTAISRLEEPQQMDTVQMVQQSMMDQRTLMKDVLEDSRLVRLQRDGGSILARLRKEVDLKYPYCENLRDAVESVTSRYNHVEEQAHILVQKSNMSLEHLNYLLQLRDMEGHFNQIQEWFHVEGKRHLLEAESVEESGDRMEQILNTFTAFLIEANGRRHHALALVSEAEQLLQRGPSYPQMEEFRTLVSTFKSGLEDFLCRAEACGRELQLIVQVCDFCEQATSLADECEEHLDRNHCSTQHTQAQTTALISQDQNSGPSSSGTQLESDQTSSKVFISGVERSILQDFQDQFLHFTAEKFQEVKDKASALQSSKGMRVWNTAWLRCQEVRQQLQERMQDLDEGRDHKPHAGSWCERHYIDVASTDIQRVPPGGPTVVVQPTPGSGQPQWDSPVSGRRKTVTSYNSDKSTTMACCDIIKAADHRGVAARQGSKVTPQSPHRLVRRSESDMRRRLPSRRARSQRDATAEAQSHTVGCQWFPWRRGLAVRLGHKERSPTPPEHRVPPAASCSHHGSLSCRILQEAQMFQRSRHGSFCSEEPCAIERGPAGAEAPSCFKHSSPSVGRCDPTSCRSGNALRLQRVLEELVSTEREYVRSLIYILTHYLPLLDRTDIPQDLRGKRGIIFGNLKKLYDFHSHSFLPELEACQTEPAEVARCFLRHTESFGLYSLYSRNKPQSDALILHSHHDIFKKKQEELGDVMDLSSYLLRPVQRISKYSLLLQDMLVLVTADRKRDVGVCLSESSSTERDEIQAAADLVCFQMRHGNDLLTMDAIQDCDVNLKEQGELIRQDEFTVFFRKNKCVRRLFLFVDLILFSKAKRTDIGNDVYVYKQSFKTSDIGMTQNSAVSSLCFEIWFRRRKREDTYTLKASSVEVKKAWTTDLERILWDQAAHSRELRIQERVFMGVGNKPFMDIKHDDAAVCHGGTGPVPLAKSKC